MVRALIDYPNNEDYIGKHVKVKSSDKIQYIRDEVIGKSGTITKQSGGSIGVTIDGKYNKASAYGTYWFEKSELKFLKNKSLHFKVEFIKNVMYNFNNEREVVANE